MATARPAWGRAPARTGVTHHEATQCAARQAPGEPAGAPTNGPISFSTVHGYGDDAFQTAQSAGGPDYEFWAARAASH